MDLRSQSAAVATKYGPILISAENDECKCNSYLSPIKLTQPFDSSLLRLQRLGMAEWFDDEAGNLCVCYLDWSKKKLSSATSTLFQSGDFGRRRPFVRPALSLGRNRNYRLVETNPNNNKNANKIFIPSPSRTRSLHKHEELEKRQTVECKRPTTVVHPYSLSLFDGLYEGRKWQSECLFGRRDLFHFMCTSPSLSRWCRFVIEFYRLNEREKNENVFSKRPHG